MKNRYVTKLRMPLVYDKLMSGLVEGHHVGFQLYVEMGGTVLANIAEGYARPEIPIENDSLMLWLSSGKPITAVAVGQQTEKGTLDLDTPVIHYLPEFAQGGKQDITIHHLLTHTGGFRAASIQWSGMNWAEIIGTICRARLEPGWVPGEKAGYHLATSWFILAELVRLSDGRPFSQYVREEIFERLGMSHSWIGMPSERYRSYGDRLGQMQNTSSGLVVPYPNDAEERGYTQCNPGSNARGSMKDLGQFYRMLLHGGTHHGVQILQPDTVSHLTTRQRIGMVDLTFRHIMDWRLGTMINSSRYGADTVPYGFGDYASEDTFGHAGSESSTAFADPRHDLVVCWVCNGRPGTQVHHVRNRAINNAIYEDLQLMA